ncbi:MAG: LysR family transcriptional regulator [Gammaproteobacteria bacterium]|nr:LysR family transcriptional regulator [Gammaproteobacteria bacterium]
MSRLNYHHLYYFWKVASLGQLTQAAESLHVSQSALSAQIRQFEHTMGVELFTRSGRRLVLTETGRQVLRYAQDIFRTGEELESLLLRGEGQQTRQLSIGVLTNLSRNFTERFIQPLLINEQVSLSLVTGDMNRLLEGLSRHELDLALTNRAVINDNNSAAATSGASPFAESAVTSGQSWQSQLVARQQLAIVGPAGLAPARNFPAGYNNVTWVLPGRGSAIRSAFESLCATWQYQPVVRAEADDMAMLRLLARDSGSLAVLPPVVVKDEIEQGVLAQYQMLPQAYENFYAITIARKYVPDALLSLLQQNSLEL